MRACVSHVLAGRSGIVKEINGPSLSLGRSEAAVQFVADEACIASPDAIDCMPPHPRAF